MFIVIKWKRIRGIKKLSWGKVFQKISYEWEFNFKTK